MRFILKFLFVGLIKKPLRSILLVLAIASSAALVFSNAGFLNIVEQKFIEASTRWTGQADLIISSEEAVNTEIYKDYKRDIEFENSLVKLKAIYDDNVHIMNIVASNIEAFNKNNPFNLIEGTKNLGKNDVIISKIFAQRYGLSINSKMKLTVNGEVFLLKVKGLADAKGVFLRDDADGNMALVSEETLSRSNKNNVFLKFKDGIEKENTARLIAAKFPEYDYEFTFDKNLLESEIQNFTLPFTLTAFAVMILGMFIIITSYQIITLGRISQIGTLRSIGATKKKVFLALLIESSIIGIFSGIIGCLLGMGLLSYVKMSYFSGPNVAQTQMIIYSKDIALVIVFSIVLAIMCAIIPVIKVIRIPIKDMIFGVSDKKGKELEKFWVLGFILIVLSTIIPRFLPNDLIGMIIASILAFLVLIGVILTIPKILDVLVKIIVSVPIIKYEVAMAARNIKDSKYLINNIKLFAVTIGIISFMSTLFGTLIYDMEKAFSKESYDVIMMTNTEDKISNEKIFDIDEVKEFEQSIYVPYITWEERNSFLNNINGIKNIKYFNYFDANIEGAEEAINSLNNGNYVIATQVLKSKLGLEIGDTIFIPIEGTNYPFEITGFIDTTYDVGHLVYVSYDKLRKLTNHPYEKYLFRSNGDSKKLKDKLMSKWSEKIIYISTVEESYLANADKIKGIFNAISSYSNMALMIGILGLISNIISGFIVRQKTFAQYKCFGMSTKQMRKMLILESIIIGLLGYGLGMVVTLSMSNCIPNIVAIFWGNVEIVSDYFKLIIIGLLSLSTMIIIAHIPVKSMEKLNIIERLKCE